MLGGIDALVFTDDIGVHNWLVRERVCENMECCGIMLNRELNRQTTGDKLSLLSAVDSKVHVLCIPTEEELVICLEGLKLLGEARDAASL